MLERSGKSPVGLRLDRDAVRVEPVGLTLVSAALAQRCLVRRHIAHVAAGLDQELGEVPTEPARAFDTPPLDRPELGRPHDRGRVSVAVVGEVSVTESRRRAGRAPSR